MWLYIWCACRRERVHAVTLSIFISVLWLRSDLLSLTQQICFHGYHVTLDISSRALELLSGPRLRVPRQSREALALHFNYSLYKPRLTLTFLWTLFEITTPSCDGGNGGVKTHSIEETKTLTLEKKINQSEGVSRHSGFKVVLTKTKKIGISDRREWRKDALVDGEWGHFCNSDN